MARDMYNNPLESTLNYVPLSDDAKGKLMVSKDVYNDPYMITSFIKD